MGVGHPGAGRKLVWRTGACLAVLSLLLATAASPAAAQQDQPASSSAGEAQLRDLIPDSAVARPEDWAKVPPSPTPTPVPTPGQTPPAEAQPAQPGEQLSSELKPDSPLAELSGFSLPWPDEKLDLPELAALTPDPDAAPALAEAITELAPIQSAAPANGKGEDRRARLAAGRVILAYPGDVATFPERRGLEERFRTLSALQALGGKEQNSLAQIGVRATSDRELLVRLLRLYGYYDGEVIQSLSGRKEEDGGLNPETARVRFDILPGARYKLGGIDLGDLAQAGPDYLPLRGSFALNTGDPLNSDRIMEEIGHLDTALGETGYPFAKLGSPSLLVDHAREEGDLTVPVKPGGKYRFGTIDSSLPGYMPSHHLARIARFHPGDTYKRSEVDDLRRAILATGLVSSLTVTPRETEPPAEGKPGTVALDVTMAKAPVHTIAGALGYDTGEGYRIEASWENRNLFPPEGALKVRGVLGTREQLAGVTFRRNNLGGRDRVLNVDLYADNATLDAYAARKVAFAASFQRLTTLIFQKPWSWSVGLEAEASEEREGVPSGVTTDRTLYITAALPLRAAFDGTDDLLDPHHGHRASLRVSPEVSRARGLTSTYARIQADASWYQPLTEKVVLAARVRLGSIPGTALENIAPSRRFYAGGGGSIRGYGYELVGPRNDFNEPKGGRSLYEVSLEARVQTGMFDGNLSLVPFLDSGGVDTSPVPGFRDMRYGAGLGIRYKTGFGPIRIDIGTPINRRPGESRIGVYVALGQSF